MSRLDPNGIAQRLADIETALTELKNPQTLSADNVLGYMTAAAATADYGRTLAAGASATMTLTFTHDHSLKGSIQQLFWFYAIDNSNVMLTYFPPWGNGPMIEVVVQKLVPNDTTNVWKIWCYNHDTITRTAYFKFFFSGTDSGSWSIT